MLNKLQLYVHAKKLKRRPLICQTYFDLFFFDELELGSHINSKASIHFESVRVMWPGPLFVIFSTEKAACVQWLQ